MSIPGEGRQLERKIIHIDMDCFYVAVEVRDNSALGWGPVAVGGRPEGRGVIATANYEARKYGVRSAMPSYQALKLCSQLKLVPPNFSKYKEESRNLRKIFLAVTETIEPLSLDEAYLDVTNVPHCGGSASRMALEIRKEIWQKCGLRASAGIAPNKFLAKVASDWNKPNGQKTIAPENVLDFVSQLPVGRLPGVGAVTTKKMHQAGWYCCGDLQPVSQFQLNRVFGLWGMRLYDLCRGRDISPVKNTRNPKTLSLEQTFARDLEYWDEIELIVRDLYKDLLVRWQKSGLNTAQIKGHFIKLKTSEFDQRTHEKRGAGLGSQAAFAKLFREAWQEGSESLRLLGMGYRLGSADEMMIEQSQMSFFPAND